MATPIDMPANPSDQQVYDCPQNGVKYVWDGEKWNQMGGGGGNGGGSARVNVSDQPPTDKVVGDLWYSTVDGILYVWYVDPTQPASGDIGQWVDVRPGNEGAAA